MIGCSIPQDILKYDTKFALNLSVREIICSGLALVGGWIGHMIGASFELAWNSYPHIILMAIGAVPFLVWGFVKIYGQPMEKIFFPIVYDNFIVPQTRLYEIHYSYEDDIPPKSSKDKYVALTKAEKSEYTAYK